MKRNLVARLCVLAAAVLAVGASRVLADDPMILNVASDGPGSSLILHPLPATNDYATNSFRNDTHTRYLTEVQIALENNDSVAHTVEVTIALGSPAHNGFPGLDTTIATFSPVTAPANSGIAGYQSYSKGLELDPSATYWVVFNSTSAKVTDPNGVSVLSYDFLISDPNFPLTAGYLAGSSDGNNWNYDNEAPGIMAAFVLNGPPPADPLVKGGVFSLITGASYLALYAPAINGLGSEAYRALLKISHATPATASVIGWNQFGAGPAYLAVTGGAAPGTAFTFKSFGDPVVSDDDEVAFSGDIATNGSTVTSADDAGVWCTLGGALSLAWQEGNPAPGLESTGDNFVAATWFNLTHGALFIGATTIEPTTNHRSSGIWMWDGSTLSKVVSLGETDVTVGGVSHGAVTTISTPLSLGNGNATSRMVSSSGHLAILLGFKDEVSAVVKY